MGEIIADQFDRTVEHTATWCVLARCNDVLFIRLLFQRTGQLVSKVRCEQVGLVQRKRHIACTQKCLVNTLLSHCLPLTGAQMSMPLLTEARHPGAVFEVERSGDDRITTIQLLAQVETDVVVHVVAQAVVGSCLERISTAPLPPADGYAR